MSSESNSPSHEALKALRDALQFSPQNIPLRQHLGDTLLSMGLPEEAEKEFREALALAPNNQSLMLGLARAFSWRNKDNHALALLEKLTKTSDAHPKAFLLPRHLRSASLRC